VLEEDDDCPVEVLEARFPPLLFDDCDRASEEDDEEDDESDSYSFVNAPPAMPASTKARIGRRRTVRRRASIASLFAVHGTRNRKGSMQEMLRSSADVSHCRILDFRSQMKLEASSRSKNLARKRLFPMMPTTVTSQKYPPTQP
jgi:hypothetical protein